MGSRRSEDASSLRRMKSVSFTHDVDRSMSYGVLSSDIYSRHTHLVFAPIHLHRIAYSLSTRAFGTISPRSLVLSNFPGGRYRIRNETPRSKKVTKKVKSDQPKPTNTPRRPNSSLEKKSTKAKPKALQCIKSYSCKTPSDAEVPVVSAITCMLHDNIVILDSKNQKLKLFSSDFVYLNSIDVPAKTRGLTSVYVSEIATTCGTTIQFYDIKRRVINKSEKEINLEFKGECFGISFNRGRYAVLCGDADEKATSTCILDKSGKEVTVINLKNLGQEMQTAETVALDGFENRIYLALKESKIICCIGFMNRKAWVIWKEPINLIPNGIFLKNHNIYVYGKDEENLEHSIDVMSPQGWTIDTLLIKTEPIMYPKCLAYQTETQRFVLVESGDSKMNIISKV